MGYIGIREENKMPYNKSETRRYIANKIRELRIDRGLTQAKLAASFETPRNTSTVTAWEIGRNTPDADTFLELCDILGVEVSAFFPRNKANVVSDEDRLRLVAVPLLNMFRESMNDYNEQVKNSVYVPYYLVKNHPEVYAVNLKYDCLNRACVDGCHVLVDPEKTPDHNSVGVVKTREWGIVVRRLLQGSSTLVLSPITHNPKQDDIVLQHEQLETIEFLGTVIWIQAAGEME